MPNKKTTPNKNQTQANLDTFKALNKQMFRRILRQSCSEQFKMIRQAEKIMRTEKKSQSRKSSTLSNRR